MATEGTSSEVNGNSGSDNVEEILRIARSGATTVTGFVDKVTLEAAAIAESQRMIAASLADAQTKLAEITSVATQAVAAKTQIADEQAVIATKSDHIQKAQQHADTVRAALDRTLTTATQQATEAEGLRSRTQSAADNATTLLTAISTTKGSVEAELTTVVTARKTAEESAAVTKGLADKSQIIETRIAAYENRLVELDTKCAAQLKTIESLLPGATSAGLAHAFDERRQTFIRPHNWWQWLFIGSLTSLVVLAISGLWQIYKADDFPTYDQLGRLWLARLPIAAALVWLAVHASRESALAKRLEEDYGYKAAIATCFEGFKKQMSDIQTGVPADSALAKLLDNTS